MSALDEREAIGKLFKAGWVVGAAVRTPIAWPNRGFTPPEFAPWVRLSILSGEAFQLTIGGVTNIHRHPGVVVVQCFAPYNTGDYEARRLADAAADIFRRQAVDGDVGVEQLVFRTPTIREVGEDQPWYQVNMSVDFYRDTIF